MNQMLTKVVFFFFFLAFGFTAFGQSHYPGMFLISFTDKDQSPFLVSKPEQFLSERAIKRRFDASISIINQDIPVNSSYIDSIVSYGAKASFSSRWLNAVLIQMDDSLNMQEILNVSFVDSMQYMAPVKSIKRKKRSKQHNKRVETGAQQAKNKIHYGESADQLNLIGLTQMHDMQFLGEGVQIAVLDNGFRGVEKMDAFEHLFSNAQLLGTKEIANPGGDVFKAGNHGTYVMTTMAAYESDVLVGSAPGASYWLIHTEDNDYEYPIEEFNWAIGAEFADSAGVDIITSSLIYSTFDESSLNHNHSQLDGKTAIISRAAQTATEKGILVFNSAGNDAVKAWHKIAFPADARDVMTIGAVNMEGVYAPFSSVGYTSDGRVKPNICAVGQGTKSISPITGEIVAINGTSFSNPTIAGAAAVLLQANPDATMEEIREAMQQSASQSNYPDSLLGFGIPNFYLAHILLNNKDVSRMNEESGFTLMPNPFVNDLFILYNVTDSQGVDIQVFDISGKLMFEEKNIPSVAGVNIMKIEKVNTLSQGMYLFVMQIGNKKYTKKMVK